MNPNKRSNYAFIDSQNLYLGVSNDVINKKGNKIYTGQFLDYRKFRTYLREKYNVKRAYIFIGFIPTNNKLYSYLQEAGYTIIFKTISTYMDEKGDVQTKGNVDTDIVLYAAAILNGEYAQAIFVSGDGDFLSLYKYLNDQGKLDKILVPNRHRYSQLLNEYREQLRFISDLKPLYRPNKKTRSGDRSATLGLPSHGDVKIVAKTSAQVKTTKGRS